MSETSPTPETTHLPGSNRPSAYVTNRAALILAVAALSIAWFAGSWWWYTCHIKNLCGNSPGLVATTTPKAPLSNRPAPTGTCDPYIVEPIIIGSDNDPENVHRLKQFLNRYQNAKLNTDDKFSIGTIHAVERFQYNHRSVVLTPYGLKKPTGNVDGATLDQINKIFCGAQPADLKG